MTRSSEWSGLRVKPNSMAGLSMPFDGVVGGELDQRVGREGEIGVVGVLRGEQDERLVALGPVLEDLGRTLDEHVSELVPVLAPPVDDKRRAAGVGDVADPAEQRRALRLRVDRGIHVRRQPREADRDDVRPAVAARRGEVADASDGEEILFQARLRSTRPCYPRDLSRVPDVTLIPIDGLPEITPGDDLARLVIRALDASGRSFQKGDVLALAQKIVSKSEGRIRNLPHPAPAPHALRMAAKPT